MHLENYKFRNDNNQRYTKQLFHEQNVQVQEGVRAINPIFSLHDDKPGLINFRKEYVADEDPTGFTTASRLLENYDHWLLLMKSPWFREAKAIWDLELDAKLTSRAFRKIQEVAVSDSPQALVAAKFLANKEYKEKRNAKTNRGRPTNEEVEGELKREVARAKDFRDDLERIRKAQS